jgi:hypothetical protein
MSVYSRATISQGKPFAVALQKSFSREIEQEHPSVTSGPDVTILALAQTNAARKAPVTLFVERVSQALARKPRGRILVKSSIFKIGIKTQRKSQRPGLILSAPNFTVDGVGTSLRNR